MREIIAAVVFLWILGVSLYLWWVDSGVAAGVFLVVALLGLGVVISIGDAVARLFRL